MAVPADDWERIQDDLKELSPEQLDKVADFVEFLRSRHEDKQSHQPTLEWAGALSDIDGVQGSVDLQHQISDWWGQSGSD